MDYPVNEQLARQLALNRMRQLGELQHRAKLKEDWKAYEIFSAERIELRDKYLKVVNEDSSIQH